MACPGFAREIVSGSLEMRGNKRTIFDRKPIVGEARGAASWQVQQGTLFPPKVDSVDERSTNAIIKH